jgi:hypothetical protein
MKKMIVLSALSMIMSAHAYATCANAALWAAGNAYGNDPKRTTTPKQLTSDTWEVTVGIGNHEDGAHTYQVTFASPNSCDPKTAVVCDMTEPSANDPRVCHQ